MLNVMVFENGEAPKLVGTISLVNGKLEFTGSIERIVVRLKKGRTDQEAYDYAPVMLSRGHMWTEDTDG